MFLGEFEKSLDNGMFRQCFERIIESSLGIMITRTLICAGSVKTEFSVVGTLLCSYINSPFVFSNETKILPRANPTIFEFTATTPAL
jgi:hypothetical protein